jgi:hypothetical protein
MIGIGPHMSEKSQIDIVRQEQERLSGILTSIDETARQNRTKIAHHDAYSAELEKEGLESVNWHITLTQGERSELAKVASKYDAGKKCGAKCGAKM